MRIALIASLELPIDRDAAGGTEVFTAELARSLSEKGHEVTVFCTANSNVAQATKYAVLSHGSYEAYEPDFRKGGYAKIEECIGYVRALNYVRDGNFDIVHHNHPNSIGSYLFKDISTPQLFTLHLPANHQYVQHLAQLFSPDELQQLKFVTVSKAQQQLKSPLHYIAAVHNGVDTDSIQFSESYGDHFVWMSRVVPEK